MAELFRRKVEGFRDDIFVTFNHRDGKLYVKLYGHTCIDLTGIRPEYDSYLESPGSERS